SVSHIVRHTTFVFILTPVPLSTANYTLSLHDALPILRERKREMEERSDAFLTLPGGIGTMEEMFEMWTSASLGFHYKPVVLYDPIGFYTPLLDWVRNLADQGLVHEEAFECLVVRDDLDAALDACGGRR